MVSLGEIWENAAALYWTGRRGLAGEEARRAWRTKRYSDCSTIMVPFNLSDVKDNHPILTILC